MQALADMEVAETAQEGGLDVSTMADEVPTDLVGIIEQVLWLMYVDQPSHSSYSACQRNSTCDLDSRWHHLLDLPPVH